MSETTTITEKSKVKVSLPTAIAILFIAGAWAVSFYSVKRDIADIKRGMFTRTDMVEWTRDLKDANPDLTVPKVSAHSASVELPGSHFVNNSKERIKSQ